MTRSNTRTPRILLTLCTLLCSQVLAQAETDKPPFKLWLSDDGETLLFDGSIHYGITAHLSQVLAETPSVRHLRLRSPGGLVAEARGMVRLITEYQLTTSVFDTCQSTCTLAFVAGQERTLEPGARLGFHSYLQTSQMMAIFMDSNQEQEKDMAIFRDQGVDEAFLVRITETPYSDMWFPTNEALLEAGILTRPANAESADPP